MLKSSSSQHVELAKQLVGSVSGDRIRNICIIAHVDHGKTSLSDFLLASNQHISLRQIEGGQRNGEAVRFLDSRMDEIDRQITIKSSCVSLTYDNQYLINLIDSPGHIDFAAEVSGAARLTDGAVLVVDVVEGVRAQTCAVVRQAWENRVVPVLFLNKMDKLANLCGDFQEANHRIRQVIENVNLLFHDLLEAEKEELGLDAIIDDRFQFDPVKGNVVFGSALHGWAFDLSSWTSRLVAPKLGGTAANSVDLVQYMYGEHAWSGKIVAVSREHPISMFSKFVLQQIWALYAADANAAQAKLSQMFPVARCVLESAVKHMPCPENSAETRSRLCFLPVEGGPTSLSYADTSVVVFVVKHHPADLSLGCLLGDRVDDIRKLTGFVGISRVFRGFISLEKSQVLFDAASKKQVSIKKIFMLMGTSLVPVSRAVAGSVVALELEQELTDSGGVTLSSDVEFPPFLSPYRSAQAIVRVTAEVRKSADESRLDEGLKLLARSDPAVSVSRHPQTGERIIGCCGDEHLARCMQDLERLFAVGVSVVISPPIVEIRESIGVNFGEQDIDPDGPLPAWLAGEFSHERSRAASFTSSDKSSCVSVVASPIPENAMQWIVKYQNALHSLFHQRQAPANVWPGKSLEECMQFVKEALRGFEVHNVKDLCVKSEAINILSSEICLNDNVKFGFQQACLSGPLAEEPVRGVHWVVTQCSVSEEHPSSASFACAQACRAAMLNSPVRISEPMLSIELQTESVKAAQTVLSQRRADIIYSDLVEGSYSEYLIKALIPASDAFRAGEKSKLTFSDELRGATHGKVVWRLSFSHWQLLNDSCPLVSHTVAHKLLCGVRKRKGLSVGEKVVADADKQRTLTKMK